MQQKWHNESFKIMHVYLYIPFFKFLLPFNGENTDVHVYSKSQRVKVKPNEATETEILHYCQS